MAAALPLGLYVATGYGGQDFEFHYTLWLALHDAWAAHEWSFGWSPGANYGLGEPSLCFYPPLSPLIGAAASFLLPARFLPAAVSWMVLFAGGVSMYLAGHTLLRPRHRLPAALLYTFSPCLFLLLFLRGSIAEAWTAALLPLAFALFLRAVSLGELRMAGFASSLLAAMWLFDIPVAIGFFYAFLAATAGLAWRQRSWKTLIVGLSVQGTAGLIAAFRLLPGLREKAWISPERLLVYDFRDTLQFRSYPRGNAPLDTAAVILVVAGLVAGLCSWRLRQVKKEATNAASAALLIFSVFAVFFQLAVSVPLWRLLPEFRFVLFAHRLLSLLVLAAILNLFEAPISNRLRRIGAAALVSCSLVAVLFFLRLPPLHHFATFAILQTITEHGYRGVLEYLPAKAPAALGDPEVQQKLLQSLQAAETQCAASTIEHRPNLLVLRTHNEARCRVQPAVFAYPFWTATLDGRTSLPLEANPADLLRVTVPPGDHVISFTFTAQTPLRFWSKVVSLLTFLFAMSWYWLVRAWDARATDGHTAPR